MSKQFLFSVAISTNTATGEFKAAYFQVRQGKSAKVKEFANGNAFADYDARGNLLGIELLAPVNIRVLSQIAPKDAKVRNFVRQNAPQTLLAAAS